MYIYKLCAGAILSTDMHCRIDHTTVARVFCDGEITSAKMTMLRGSTAQSPTNDRARYYLVMGGYNITGVWLGRCTDTNPCLFSDVLLFAVCDCDCCFRWEEGGSINLKRYCAFVYPAFTIRRRDGREIAGYFWREPPVSYPSYLPLAIGTTACFVRELNC